MNNIVQVTEHLRRNMEAAGEYVDGRVLEIVKGWVMSMKFDLSMRFKFVSMLTAFRDNANYNTRRLRDMQTCKTYMTEKDYEVLNKLLRGVKRT